MRARSRAVVDIPAAGMTACLTLRRFQVQACTRSLRRPPATGTQRSHALSGTPGTYRRVSPARGGWPLPGWPTAAIGVEAGISLQLQSDPTDMRRRSRPVRRHLFSADRRIPRQHY
jgi:hypothetical protein